MALSPIIRAAYSKHASPLPPRTAACAAKDLSAILHKTNYGFGAMALFALAVAKASGLAAVLSLVSP